jgi:transposase
MPRIHYPAVIVESVDTLATLERELRGRPTQPRVTMLRLLKSGAARSLVAVAPLVGYGERTVNRWWKLYQTEGLPQLLEQRPHPGKPSQVTEVAWADLEAAMTRGEIATLADAQRFLHTHHGITYASLHGVWWLLRQRKVRLKTGRRRHRQADATAQTEYKRCLRSDAADGAVCERLGVR